MHSAIHRDDTIGLPSLRPSVVTFLFKDVDPQPSVGTSRRAIATFFAASLTGDARSLFVRRRQHQRLSQQDDLLVVITIDDLQAQNGTSPLVDRY